MSEKDIARRLLDLCEPPLVKIERQGKEIKRLRELLERVILPATENNKGLREENERLQGLLDQLHAACADLVYSAQCGKYGEIICDIGDFNAVEKLFLYNQEKKA